jgi:hypothetical protein
MIKKIVCFSTTPITKQGYKNFNVDIFKRSGFELIFFDFSPITFPALYKAAFFLGFPESEDYFLFHDKKKAIDSIRQLGKDSFVLMTTYYQKENFIFFQALSKKNIPYAIICTESVPSGFGVYGVPFWLKVFLKLYNLNFRKLKALFYKPEFAPLFKVRSPNICILGGEKSLKINGKAALVGEDTELLWTHARDYNSYLDQLDQEVVEENIAVFLDSGAPTFPFDQTLPHGKTHLSVKKYYPSICRFLDHVEKELGLKVIIAAHPKSKHVKFPEYYGGRLTVRDQTFALIKKSKLVISHQSMALTWIVLERKPWLYLTTAEYGVDLHYSRGMKVTADFLGKTLIDIDNDPYPIDWDKELYVNDELYLKYEKQHIKKEGSEMLNTWQIFINRLKKWNENC